MYKDVSYMYKDINIQIPITLFGSPNSSFEITCILGLAIRYAP